MNERILPSPILQIFFVSRETSNCPLISEMIKLGKRLEEVGLADNEAGIVSLDYGKRLLINAKNIDLKKMTQHDVVEIVDYDPLKNIMMVIGTKDPCLETPVHWIIQKARHDINALLQINSTTLFERLKGILPTTEKETQPITLDRAKEILKTLRAGKTILIKNEGILFVGINIKEIQDALLNYLGVQK
jgi:ribulose-5-phosphate 4-epimerase/fuculose-1-phosphate aldolase